MMCGNRSRNLNLTALLGMLILCLFGCAPLQPTGTGLPDPTREVDQQPESGSGSESSQPQGVHDLSPGTSRQDLEVLVAGNSAFAWDFYRVVRGQEGNLFYSPYSISAALAMTYAGARRDTEKQIAETLHYDLPQEGLHPAFKSLAAALNSAAEIVSDDQDQQPFQLNIANSLWGQSGYPFRSQFLDLLALNYQSGLRLVDFRNQPDDARLEINQWVADETADRISDLIPEGEIDLLTRLVLVNAIYFKANWSHPFAVEETTDRPFTLLDGSVLDVPMMSHEQPERLPYLAGDGFKAVALPYAGGTTSMVIIVPGAGPDTGLVDGKFQEFEAALDRELVDEILAGLEPGLVSLTMPKFSFESEYRLKDTLEAMGMPDAFDPHRADFSAMEDPQEELFIDDVFHKAFLAVDEKGTEAAAATAVVMSALSAISGEIELTVDRPFIFLIQDQTSGAILFVGRVLNPES